LTQSLVEVAKGAVAGGSVFHDPDRHRRANDSGHRPDRSVRMAWLQGHHTAASQRFRGLESVRPAFVKNGTGDRALLRTAHVRPGDGWSRVQNPALTAGKGGDGIAGEHKIRETRLRGKVAVVSPAVGPFDARVADHPGQRPA